MIDKLEILKSRLLFRVHGSARISGMKQRRNGKNAGCIPGFSPLKNSRMDLGPIIAAGLLLILAAPLFSMQVVRNNSALREGPAVFFTPIIYLRTGSELEKLSESDDGLWFEVQAGTYSGWIAATAVSSSNSSVPALNQPFSSQFGVPGRNPFGGSLQIISPGSYVAAVKGFAQNYVHSSGLKTVDMELLLEMTEFSFRDYRKVRRELGLNETLRRRDFINGKDPTFTNEMEKVGLAVSMSILSQGVVKDPVNTRKINIIANILNSQTRNYATRIRCWVLPDAQPNSYSAPAGHLFFTRGLLSVLDNDDQLIAVIAHEIGHLAIGHGRDDLQTEQIRNTAVNSVMNMESSIVEMGGSTDEVSKELRQEADRAYENFKIVRDDWEEFEADAFTIKLIRKNGIGKKSLKQALERALAATSGGDPRYIAQMKKRLAKI